MTSNNIRICLTKEEPLQEIYRSCPHHLYPIGHGHRRRKSDSEAERSRNAPAVSRTAVPGDLEIQLSHYKRVGTEYRALSCVCRCLDLLIVPASAFLPACCPHQ
ncbi:hypothetical protein Q8A67_008653 [Cirrhinus molitorella]|uniref:Uncharacterized protein n=1 Tax=Cirrhinus molitorella TaxID=172907 RepID=A0AA88PXS9_9TELE|nr:hypothetical protein Q8A67_008653 [Cirrhinus molitorella]